jgi:hypothetical protein
MGIAVKVTDGQGDRISPPIAQAISKRQCDEELAEQARVLYVAMTRARDHLLLCGPPNANRETQWLTSFDSLFGLYARENGAEFSGDGWRARVLRKPPSTCAASTAKLSPPIPAWDVIEARIAPIPTSETLRKSVGVTTALGAFDERDMEDEYQHGRQIHPDAYDAALRGTLIHRFLELWDFRTPPGEIVDEFLLAECPLRLLRERLGAELRDLASRISASELGRSIAAGKNVQKEIPFAFSLGERLVKGTIDLLLDGETIVDYKTGGRRTETHLKYERQLRIYAGAAGLLRGMRPTHAYLLYLDDPAPTWQCEVDVSKPLVDATMDMLRVELQTTESEVLFGAT